MLNKIDANRTMRHRIISDGVYCYGTMHVMVTDLKPMGGMGGGKNGKVGAKKINANKT